MPKLLFPILRPNDPDLPTGRANGKFHQREISGNRRLAEARRQLAGRARELFRCVGSGNEEAMIQRRFTHPISSAAISFGREAYLAATKSHTFGALGID